jgi:hypothetical protein
LPIFSIEEGMEIECNPRFIKSSEQSLRSFDPDSKTTVVICLHSLKQFWPILSTDDGMQMDSKNAQLAKAVLPNRAT